MFFLGEAPLRKRLIRICIRKKWRTGHWFIEQSCKPLFGGSTWLLGTAYDADGLTIDKTKAAYHYKIVAKAGHPFAWINLIVGLLESEIRTDELQQSIEAHYDRRKEWTRKVVERYSRAVEGQTSNKRRIFLSIGWIPASCRRNQERPKRENRRLLAGPKRECMTIRLEDGLSLNKGVASSWRGLLVLQDLSVFIFRVIIRSNLWVGLHHRDSLRRPNHSNRCSFHNRCVSGTDTIPGHVLAERKRQSCSLLLLLSLVALVSKHKRPAVEQDTVGVEDGEHPVRRPTTTAPLNGGVSKSRKGGLSVTKPKVVTYLSRILFGGRSLVATNKVRN